MSDTFANAPAEVQLRALAGQLRHDATLTELDTPETAARRLRHYADLLDQVRATIEQETL
ncbi:hypothetical protein [Rhodococcus sp. RDE2]|uniref:hypothetical protein n=1 Tax=Rhodococcus sp. RDE2 TaxID=2885078 RepID=UPI001E5DFC93|nr:hypothetical protein [Rhodococcus sp. RDE2]BDB62334.1 hypothetical protein RDE2_41280 [Rhodococcus sp. RDE2]